MYDGPEGQVSVQYWENKAYLHCRCNKDKWGVSAYKKLYLVLTYISYYLNEKGYDKLYTLIPDNDSKLFKFQLMFGFTSEYSVNGAILLSRKT